MLTPIRMEGGRPGLSLDLGCGCLPKNPFGLEFVIGVDIANKDDSGWLAVADLAIAPIPFQDNTFDAISAFDFIEHIPRVIYMPKRREPFLQLMQEIFRCLKPGGSFLSLTPAYPNTSAFRDPTHVNIITEETFPMYFCGRDNLSAMYGISVSFELCHQEWKEDGKLLTHMKKI